MSGIGDKKSLIKAGVGVINISEKMRDAILRWLGHVERKVQ